MNYKFRLFLTLIFLMLPVLNSRAQDFAVKTNLLYDATATANAGLSLPRKSSLHQLLFQGKYILALDSFIFDLIHDLADEEYTQSSYLAVIC